MISKPSAVLLLHFIALQLSCQTFVDHSSLQEQSLTTGARFATSIRSRIKHASGCCPSDGEGETHRRPQTPVFSDNELLADEASMTSDEISSSFLSNGRTDEDELQDGGASGRNRGCGVEEAVADCLRCVLSVQHLTAGMIFLSVRLACFPTF